MESLTVRHNALKTTAIVNANVCRPACLDRENLQFVCHFSGRRVYHPMIEYMVPRAVTFNHRVKEDPDYIRSPLPYDRGHALVIGVAELREHVTQGPALCTNASESARGYVGWQSHRAYRSGHLI